MTIGPPLSLGALIRADLARFRALAGQGGHGSLWRAFLHPRVAPVAWFRVAHWLTNHRLRPLATVVAQMNLMVFRVEIPARALIGPGFVLPHPQGIVIGSASIGNNVTVYQNVTLGARAFEGAYDLTKRPVIHDEVVIGAGAVVLGPVHIGQGAVVRANAVVVRDMVARGTQAEAGGEGDHD